MDKHYTSYLSDKELKSEFDHIKRCLDRERASKKLAELEIEVREIRIKDTEDRIARLSEQFDTVVQEMTTRSGD